MAQNSNPGILHFTLSPPSANANSFPGIAPVSLRRPHTPVGVLMADGAVRYIRVLTKMPDGSLR